MTGATELPTLAVRSRWQLCDASWQQGIGGMNVTEDCQKASHRLQGFWTTMIGYVNGEKKKVLTDLG